MFARAIKTLARPMNTQVKRAGFVAAHTSEGVGASKKFVGGSAARGIPSDDVLEQEYREEPPSGFESVLFTQLPRPRLTERAASEMSLDQARHFAEHAKRFYRFDFPLFTRSDLFYEEVEEDYLNKALGLCDDSIDRRFLDVSTLFRQTINANTRRIHLYWMPALFALIFGAAIYAAMFLDVVSAMPLTMSLGTDAILFGGAALFTFLTLLLVYSWPYKFVQQRNLMNLDNYITSKFSRINNNFQVAKRRALNVEREKRIRQQEELKEEAGAWTLSYQWFAMRLFLCELALRNKLYQVRRNTVLYWLAGILATLFLMMGGALVIVMLGGGASLVATYAASAFVFLVAASLLLRRAPIMMFRVLQSNEWARFHQIDLDETIRDHVGEDKLQIVTFRDRNRME